MGTPRAVRTFTVSCALLLGLSLVGSPRAQSGTTELVSVDALGEAASDNSVNQNPRVSPNGRYVTFESNAHLALPDGFGHRLYVRDRLTGITQLVSVTTTGAMGSSESPAPVTSTGLVASYTAATNLVTLPPPGDTNGADDVILNDLVDGTAVLVSGTPARVGNAWSSLPAISADGSCVAFVSAATNLVPDDTPTPDVYLRDLASGAITRVSVSSGGTSGDLWSGQPFAQVLEDLRVCSLSGDGRWTAFVSAATNLVPADLNGKTDIFVHDRLTGTTTRVSVDSAGAEADADSTQPSISADGRFVAFQSTASNLVPGGFVSTLPAVYLHDRHSGQTAMVSVSTAGTRATGQLPSLSEDGRFVVFESTASTLVASDGNDVSDIFRHDRVTGATMRVSLDSDGLPGDRPSVSPSISADGRTVAFVSSWEFVPLPDDPFLAFMQVYVRTVDGWSDVGAALPGGGGLPELHGSGSLLPSQPGALDLQYAWPFAPSMLLVSVGSTPVPFKGGTLKAFPALLQVPMSTNLLGQIHLPFVWPVGVPSQAELYFQFAILDPEAIHGVALSNALHALTP